MAVIEAIATTYLEADAASVTFSSIPSTYEHLQIRISSRNTFAYKQGSGRLTFNSIAGTAYSHHYMAGHSAGESANRSTGDGNIRAPVLMTGNGISGTTGGVDRTDYGVAVIDILDYANSNKNTTLLQMGGNSLTTTGPYVWFGSGLVDDTAVVIAITLDSDGSWMRGTEISLYGITG